MEAFPSTDTRTMKNEMNIFSNLLNKLHDIIPTTQKTIEKLYKHLLMTHEQGGEVHIHLIMMYEAI